MITVPGVGAVHHVAYTVPDLDQAVTFFTDALGAQLAYLTGPVAAFDGVLCLGLAGRLALRRGLPGVNGVPLPVARW